MEEISGSEEDPDAEEVALHHGLWILLFPDTGRVNRVLFGYELMTRPKAPPQDQPLRLAPPALSVRRLEAVAEEPRDPPCPGNAQEA